MKNRFWLIALVMLALVPVVHADVYEDQEEQQQEEAQEEEQEEQEQPQQPMPQPQPSQTIINNYYNGFNPGVNFINPCGGCVAGPVLRGGPVLAPWWGGPGGVIAVPPTRRFPPCWGAAPCGVPVNPCWGGPCGGGPVGPCVTGPCGGVRPMPFGQPFSENKSSSLKANVSAQECKVEMVNNATFELVVYQDKGARTVLFRDETTRSDENANIMKKFYEQAEIGICTKVFGKTKELDI